jgi:hypothetical protein
MLAMPGGKRILDALDVSIACPAGGATMVIRAVEPHPHINWLERHTFQCIACEHTEKHMLGVAA